MLPTYTSRQYAWIWRAGFGCNFRHSLIFFLVCVASVYARLHFGCVSAHMVPICTSPQYAWICLARCLLCFVIAVVFLLPCPASIYALLQFGRVLVRLVHLHGLKSCFLQHGRGLPRKPQKVPGGSRRPQEAPGGPGSPRRPQGASGPLIAVASLGLSGPGG